LKDLVAEVGDISTTVSQTFFIPMPDQNLFDDVFHVLDSGAKQPIHALISLTVGTTGTIIYYDHWEDGFDSNVYAPNQKSTEIWGDGNATNGCVPVYQRSCNGDEDDYLIAGDIIIFDNTIDLPRQKSAIRYDGGDRVQSNYPIAVVRGGYPDYPGSLMAGAVEVLDQSLWGTQFVAPVGEGGNLLDTNAFEVTLFFIMAGEDNTVVTLPDSSTVTLNMGQSKTIHVQQAKVVTTSKPCQVDLLAGDIGDTWELRWFSLLDVNKWSESYLSPVGDSTGQSRILMYYHGPKTQITVNIETTTASKAYTLKKQQPLMSDIIPDGTGALITSSSQDTFIALSITDTKSGGQIYDWGFPIQPVNQLTTQVLVGLGFGCTNNNCATGSSRSVVWVAPTEDCYIHIDYDNDGTVDKSFSTNRLQSMKFADDTTNGENDQDMSGAILFATKTSDTSSQPVSFAAAWGQDPSRSFSGDDYALDLGTTILPFDAIKVFQTLNLTSDNDHDGKISCGDQIQFCIHCQNVGQVDVPANALTFKITKPDTQTTSIAGSGRYTCNTGETKSFADGVLDGTGLKNQYTLQRRGGTHQICSLATVNEVDKIDKTFVSSSGTIVERNMPFSCGSEISFQAQIDIQKTVLSGAKDICKDGEELLSGYNSQPITYCFKVTNIGTTYLKDVVVDDSDLKFTYSISTILAPNDVVYVPFNTAIDGDKSSFAKATGNPCLANGDDIAQLPDVYDSDDAGVKQIPIPIANINVEKTVFLGSITTCTTGAELVYGKVGAAITYCYQVTNVGESTLQVSLTDSGVKMPQMDVGSLAPGQTSFVRFETTIPAGGVASTATATGTPIILNSDGTAGAAQKVIDIDTAGVQPVEPSITISKTVHRGSLAVTSCSEGDELLTGKEGSFVTYCYLVTNTGNTKLAAVKVTDAGISMPSKTVGTLAPGDTKYVNFVTLIPSGGANTDGTAVGNPVDTAGNDIPGIDDVVASDSAAVQPIYPSISLSKTVHAGYINTCSTGQELVVGIKGDGVTYCFEVTNTGDTPLTTSVVDTEIKMPQQNIPGKLMPRQSAFVKFQAVIPSGGVNSTATATGIPVDENGNGIPGLDNVKATDSAAVEEKLGPSCGVPMVKLLGINGDEADKYPLSDLPLQVIQLGTNDVGSQTVTFRLCPTNLPKGVTAVWTRSRGPDVFCNYITDITKCVDYNVVCSETAPNNFAIVDVYGASSGGIPGIVPDCCTKDGEPNAVEYTFMVYCDCPLSVSA
jgi:hypothetical protein